mgnify:CR=1 FL=1
MLQQRLTDRLVKYWENLRKEGETPDYALFNKMAIQDIWDGCIVMQAQPVAAGAAPRFQFREMGEKTLSLFAQDPTNQYFSVGARVFPAARIMRRLPEVIASPGPLVDEGQFVTEKSKVVKFRSCLVPFSKEGKITYVVVGLSWREF